MTKNKALLCYSFLPPKKVHQPLTFQALSHSISKEYQHQQKKKKRKKTLRAL